MKTIIMVLMTFLYGYLYGKIGMPLKEGDNNETNF